MPLAICGIANLTAALLPSHSSPFLLLLPLSPPRLSAAVRLPFAERGRKVAGGTAFRDSGNCLGAPLKAPFKARDARLAKFAERPLSKGTPDE